MIKLEKTTIHGLEESIRGMRNPKNSWDKSDSYKTFIEDPQTMETAEFQFFVGENDLKLMQTLADAGPVHGKFRRMITVYVDITAPLYWWKEFDTYKVGTVANSCSTMHKIADKKFEMSDFSTEHLVSASYKCLGFTVKTLNDFRDCYIFYDKMKNGDIPVADEIKPIIDKYSKKDIWWQLIQLLPSSYNQKRTVMMNYEVLSNIYHYRKDHKLDEWHEVCSWIENLPHSELIIGGAK